jgi:hypothetical protein
MRLQIIRATWYGLGLIAMVLAIQGQAHAGTVTPVPEIDGSTLSAGLALLSASALIIRSRMRSK